MSNHLFISYKHKADSTAVANRFHEYLQAMKAGLGIDAIFMDEVIEAGEQWSEEVQQNLEETTHFISLLTSTYWLAPQCQRELLFALQRFEATGTPRLLFVLMEPLDPAWLVFDAQSGKGQLNKGGAKVEAVGDINFLGPFNDARQLVPMKSAADPDLSTQLFQLTQRLQRVLN